MSRAYRSLSVKDNSRLRAGEQPMKRGRRGSHIVSLSELAGPLGRGGPRAAWLDADDEDQR